MAAASISQSGGGALRRPRRPPAPAEVDAPKSELVERAELEREGENLETMGAM
jgi:hypothetical protein